MRTFDPRFGMRTFEARLGMRTFDPRFGMRTFDPRFGMRTFEPRGSASGVRDTAPAALWFERQGPPAHVRIVDPARV